MKDGLWFVFVDIVVVVDVVVALRGCSFSVSKAVLGKLLRDGVERIITGFFECIDTTLELN